MCDALVDLIDGGPAAGEVRIYDVGSGVPADADVAITDQTLLATLAFSDPAFGAASDVNPGARAAANSITESSNATAGSAAFFRALDSTGTVIIQGLCGTDAEDCIMNTTTISSGATVAITAYTVTVPEG
jgi:hypothetical protein